MKKENSAINHDGIITPTQVVQQAMVNIFYISNRLLFRQTKDNTLLSFLKWQAVHYKQALAANNLVTIVYTINQIEDISQHRKEYQLSSLKKITQAIDDCQQAIDQDYLKLQKQLRDSKQESSRSVSTIIQRSNDRLLLNDVAVLKLALSDLMTLKPESNFAKEHHFILLQAQLIYLIFHARPNEKNQYQDQISLLFNQLNTMVLTEQEKNLLTILKEYAQIDHTEPTFSIHIFKFVKIIQRFSIELISNYQPIIKETINSESTIRSELTQLTRNHFHTTFEKICSKFRVIWLHMQLRSYKKAHQDLEALIDQISEYRDKQKNLFPFLNPFLIKLKLVSYLWLTELLFHKSCPNGAKIALYAAIDFFSENSSTYSEHSRLSEEISHHFKKEHPLLDHIRSAEQSVIKKEVNRAHQIFCDLDILSLNVSHKMILQATSFQQIMAIPIRKLNRDSLILVQDDANFRLLKNLLKINVLLIGYLNPEEQVTTIKGVIRDIQILLMHIIKSMHPADVAHQLNHLNQIAQKWPESHQRDLVTTCSTLDRYLKSLYFKDQAFIGDFFILKDKQLSLIPIAEADIYFDPIAILKPPNHLSLYCILISSSDQNFCTEFKQSSEPDVLQNHLIAFKYHLDRAKAIIYAKKHRAAAQYLLVLKGKVEKIFVDLELNTISPQQVFLIIHIKKLYLILLLRYFLCKQVGLIHEMEDKQSDTAELEQSFIDLSELYSNYGEVINEFLGYIGKLLENLSFFKENLYEGVSYLKEAQAFIERVKKFYNEKAKDFLRLQMLQEKKLSCSKRNISKKISKNTEEKFFYINEHIKYNTHYDSFIALLIHEIKTIMLESIQNKNIIIINLLFHIIKNYLVSDDFFKKNLLEFKTKFTVENSKKLKIPEKRAILHEAKLYLKNKNQINASDALRSDQDTLQSIYLIKYGYFLGQTANFKKAIFLLMQANLNLLKKEKMISEAIQPVNYTQEDIDFCQHHVLTCQFLITQCQLLNILISDPNRDTLKKNSELKTLFSNFDKFKFSTNTELQKVVRQLAGEIFSKSILLAQDRPSYFTSNFDLLKTIRQYSIVKILNYDVVVMPAHQSYAAEQIASYQAEYEQLNQIRLKSVIDEICCWFRMAWLHIQLQQYNKAIRLLEKLSEKIEEVLKLNLFSVAAYKPFLLKIKLVGFLWLAYIFQHNLNQGEIKSILKLAALFFHQRCRVYSQRVNLAQELKAHSFLGNDHPFYQLLLRHTNIDQSKKIYIYDEKRIFSPKKSKKKRGKSSNTTRFPKVRSDYNKNNSLERMKPKEHFEPIIEKTVSSISTPIVRDEWVELLGKEINFLQDAEIFFPFFEKLSEFCQSEKMPQPQLFGGCLRSLFKSIKPNDYDINIAINHNEGILLLESFLLQSGARKSAYIKNLFRILFNNGRITVFVDIKIGTELEFDFIINSFRARHMSGKWHIFYNKQLFSNNQDALSHIEKNTLDMVNLEKSAHLVVKSVRIAMEEKFMLSKNTIKFIHKKKILLPMESIGQIICALDKISISSQNEALNAFYRLGILPYLFCHVGNNEEIFEILTQLKIVKPHVTLSTLYQLSQFGGWFINKDTQIQFTINFTLIKAPHNIIYLLSICLDQKIDFELAYFSDIMKKIPSDVFSEQAINDSWHDIQSALNSLLINGQLCLSLIFLLKKGGIMEKIFPGAIYSMRHHATYHRLMMGILQGKEVNQPIQLRRRLSIGYLCAHFLVGEILYYYKSEEIDFLKHKWLVAERQEVKKQFVNLLKHRCLLASMQDHHINDLFSIIDEHRLNTKNTPNTIMFITQRRVQQGTSSHTLDSRLRMGT